MDALKNQKPQTVIKEVPIETNQNLTISAQEVEHYLTGVGRVDCKKNYGTVGYSDVVVGSSSLWNFSGIGYAILTNRHVVANIPSTGGCTLNIADAGDIKADKNRTEGGFWWLDTDNTFNWNNKTDVAVLKITHDFIYGDPPTGLNYSINSLPLCDKKMPLNSPVVAVGYPATTMVKTTEGIYAYRTVTNGIISAQDESAVISDGLPYPNYFISAKIDSGNSGGIAFSKNSKGLCVLGIPTWVSVGNYETQGVIQNIHNVFYKE